MLATFHAMNRETGKKPEFLSLNVPANTQQEAGYGMTVSFNTSINLDNCTLRVYNASNVLLTTANIATKNTTNYLYFSVSSWSAGNYISKYQLESQDGKLSDMITKTTNFTVYVPPPPPDYATSFSGSIGLNMDNNMYYEGIVVSGTIYNQFGSPMSGYLVGTGQALYVGNNARTLDSSLYGLGVWCDHGDVGPWTRSFTLYASDGTAGNSVSISISILTCNLP